MKKEYFKIIPAVYLVLRRGTEILLLRRANTGYQDGRYSLVAGHLDGGELSRHALAREAKEEAGIDINPESLKLVHVVHSLFKNEVDQERIGLFFETREWSGDVVNMEPNKCDDLAWYPIDQLPNTTIPMIRSVIGATINKVPYSEYEQELV